MLCYPIDLHFVHKFELSGWGKKKKKKKKKEKEKVRFWERPRETKIKHMSYSRS